MTVSRALNNSDRVSQNTKERILEIAASLGFEINANARALSSYKTGSIAIVFPTSYDNPNNSQYTALFLHDVRENLERFGYDSLLISLRNHCNGQGNIRRIAKQKKVDGFILINIILNDSDYEFLKTREIPFVYLDPSGVMNSSHEVDSFSVDNVLGGRMATDCLIERGQSSNLLCLSLSDSPVKSNISDRPVGFRQSLEQHGMDYSQDMVQYLGSGTVFDMGYSYIEKNIELIRERKIDGIFACADLLALGAIARLKEESINIPQQIRIVGYDDATISSYFPPKLTTLHQPREQLTYLACRRIDELLSGHASGETISEKLPPKLMIRESC